jgi:heterodisulfide reductase subunit C2
MTSLSNPVATPITCERIQELSGQPISTCFQCEKCTNGCPMAFAMDISPHRVMHSLRLGLVADVLNSDTIWVCASCQTCTTRCPNGIDIEHVMGTLRQLSIKHGVKPSQKIAPQFHQAFLNNIRRLGRMHELTMGVEFALRSEGIKGVMKQANLGLNMIRKGKMKLLPGRLNAGKDIKDIFREFRG